MTIIDHHASSVELISARARELQRKLDETLAGYKAGQTALAVRYGVASVVPQPYTAATRAAIVQRAEQCAESWDFAWTSGTTNEPKQIFYPASRLRSLAEHYVDQILLTTVAYGVTAPRFYFLNSFSADGSISALLARTPPPSAFAADVLGDYFAFRRVATKFAPRYSTLALNWAMIWSLRPTAVTTVNPSSLCLLLRAGRSSWPALREQARRIFDEGDWTEALESRGCAKTRSEVLDWLAATTVPPAPAEMLPDVELISCWQGGYVRPFVEQLREQLSPLRPHLAPMFSLSTEVVAASMFPHLSRDAGLPISSECCYEFLVRDADSVSDNVLSPWELVPGEEYRMVVSDAYGLLRYDTQDVFRCVGRAADAPLIQFVRRHGLNYSFTGEKLTDCQLQAAYAEVAAANGLKGAALTCFPYRGPGAVPGYVFVLLSSDSTLDREEIARQFDAVLCRINLEYASKRASDRLAAPSLITMPAEALTAKLAAASPRGAATNPGQFKFLPLYTQLWDDILSATKDAS